MTAQHLAALTSPVSYKPKVYLTQGGLLIVSRLFSSSTPPPINSTIITTTLSLNPAFLFLHPPHLPTSYLRELGENQSFVRAYMLLQPALLPSQGISAISRRTAWDGRAEWEGGYHMKRPGMQSDAGWSSGGRWVPLTNWLQHPRALFFPLLSISVQFTPVTSPPPLPPHCSVIQREGKPSSSLLQQPVGGPGNPKWYVRPFFRSVLVVFQCCWLSSLDHSCQRENLAITMKDEVEVYTPVLWEYFVITEL